MKTVIRAILLLAALTAPAALLFAQSTEVTYYQGTANLKDSGGNMSPVDFGTVVNYGDTIITGSDGTVQLDQNGVNQITIQPNSVFSLQQRVQDTKPRTVMTTVLGSVAYKFAQLAGTTEPDLGTMSSVAGIRGTALTVYAGSDGSSLFVVTQGKVAVQAEGQTVDLAVNEAVQVTPGAPPGKKFMVLAGKIDFSKWNSQQESAFANDPVAALAAVGKRMDSLIGQIKQIEPTYLKWKTDLDANRAELKKLRDAGKMAEAKTFYEQKVNPLEVDASNLYLNLRYWALSALSLRKYVMGRMDLSMKISNLKTPSNTTFTRFEQLFSQIDSSFNNAVVPYLVPTDI